MVFVRADGTQQSWGDVVDEYEKREAAVHAGRVQWGIWSYNPRNFTLSCPLYEIPLEQIQDSAAALDYIVQLSHKAWLTNDALGELVRALDELLKFQTHFCSHRTEQGPVDVVALLRPMSEVTAKQDGES